MPRLTLKASMFGKQRIKEARIKKIAEFREKEGDIDIDEIFLREASKILKPNRKWGNSEDKYAVSLPTWTRFRQAKTRIDADYFKAFCQVLELDWEEIVESEMDANTDLSEAPALTKFYGRKQELGELQQLVKRCRLILVYGMGGVGKSALVSQLLDRVAKQYHRLIWLSLQSSPPFSETINQLIQFFSKGEKEAGNLNDVIQELQRQKCLMVIDSWDEIIDNIREDYAQYNQFLEKIHKTQHQSCVVVISRRRPKNIELEGKFVESIRLQSLRDEEIREFIKAEGLFGSVEEIRKFSRLYNNPWIVKRIIQRIQTVFNGEISPFMNNGESTTFMDEATTDFLNQQFQKLSQMEVNLMYCVAIRRNTVSWNQLVQDSKAFLRQQQLIEYVNSLISQHSLLYTNTEEEPLIYALEPVILKYTTERFVEQVYQQIIEVMNKGVISGNELFITHQFITEHPVDEELHREQTRRIVQRIQQMLVQNFKIQQHLETQLRKIQSLLEEQGYDARNISHLLAACKVCVN
ncbi:nSTAND1 domain-containing NTPase [Nostoc sp. CMAA1605]|uniref:nSTAND1 domain-containing NTPase n=1 Tax=Nostoc sp. CMAA1605 TaxID=2055159 RepID=UPI001F18B62B|nr:ATP-binding protein [Nostoc sp. CMAA1605]MCF4967135.1 hypothetical protein [Nostoc sp. CMAA1605]